MSTTMRSRNWMPLARTMLLGLVPALAIAVVGQPQAAWPGFVAAAMYAAGGGGRSCLRRRPTRPA